MYRSEAELLPLCSESDSPEVTKRQDDGLKLDLMQQEKLAWILARCLSYHTAFDPIVQIRLQSAMSYEALVFETCLKI